ncbi:transforming growth factor, beta receptor associated protein 1 [Mortierella polycephala]|uniref:Transforming growth factor, beta receptor associated protein 1 n=1 Tax=Mortierella polycephala TaxID=41804 RepID=A0A9P6Q7N0_9FUNG|nr:transforming growth factor, beta receptor associated protein 1 [Mortierella polycephala]
MLELPEITTSMPLTLSRTADSTLSFFSLPNFSPISHQILAPIKGVTAFCQDDSQKGRSTEDGSIRLCVIKRRIIQFYNLWPDAISEPKSSSSGSNAQVLKPACIAIAENEFLLASATSSGQTAIGVFCTGTGDPVRGTLHWSSYPRALGVEFPYVAALLRNNIIEIHNILDQKLIQTIRFEPSAEMRSLVQGPGLAVWMSTLANILTLQPTVQSSLLDAQQQERLEMKRQDEIRISTVLARILVAGKESVSALVTTPLVLHADILLQQGRVEEALLLSEKATTTMSPENLHSERLQLELDYIYQKSGLIYLAETLFDDAFTLLKRGNISPQIIMAMFPGVLQRKGLINDVNLFQGIRGELSALGSLPQIVNRALAKTGGDQDAEYGKVLLTNARDILTQYLMKCRKEYAARKIRTGAEVEHSLLLGEIKDSAFNIGLQGMANLLRSLTDIHLVEDYGWWVVEQDEATGLEIFMPSEAKRAAMFDLDHILSKCKAIVSRQGLITYLEYVVFQRKSESSDHHAMLCLLYVEVIGTLMSNPSINAKHLENVTEFAKQQEHQLLYSGAVRQDDKGLSGSISTFMCHLEIHSKADPLCSYRLRFSQLLQSSRFYDAKDILPHVEMIQILLYEKAVLLSRILKYEECLGILVKDIKDYQGAEIFCLNGGTFRSPKNSFKARTTGRAPLKECPDDMDMRRKLFMILLQEYLRMAQDRGGMALTLRLLNSQSTYLDISEVIQLLPPVWSVEMLQQYLLRSLRKSYHEFKEIQVVKGLSLGENLRVSQELFQLYATQGPVVVTPDDICHVCGSAVADAVFMRTVDMKIIHLHCGTE